MKKMISAFALTSLLIACGQAPDNKGSIVQTDGLAGVAGGEVLPASKLPPLGLVFDGDNNWCSAVLVGPQTVLTAAHCCVGYLHDDINFLDAEGRLSASVPGSKTVPPQYGHYTDLPADHSYLIRYPEFNVAHDACLIALQKPAAAAPMTLNLNPWAVSKGNAIVAGWGINNHTEPLQFDRMIGEMKIEAFSHEGIRAFNSKTYMMPGDSGSGIFIENKKHELLQIGVTSTSISGFCWGFNATNGEGLGGVYKKVSHHELVEVGQPSTPNAACFPQAPPDMTRHEVFFPSGTSGFYNTSSLEFVFLLRRFANSHDSRICGYNTNCAPVYR